VFLRIAYLFSLTDVAAGQFGLQFAFLSLLYISLNAKGNEETPIWNVILAFVVCFSFGIQSWGYKYFI
jgi:hypothetical protein